MTQSEVTGEAKEGHRWTLVHQILWPMLGLILAIHVGWYWATSSWIAQRQFGEVESRLESLVETTQKLQIPLSQSVLNQLKGLSGAEYQVMNQQGQVIDSTLDIEPHSRLRALLELTDPQVSSAGKSIRLMDRWYLAATVPLRPNQRGQHQLMIFYSLENLKREQWDAVRPVILIGGMSLAIATLLAIGLALRISKPVQQLREHVEQVTYAPFAPVPIPHRNDELRDLSVAFNQMGDRLRGYEQTIRRTEHLRLLGQVRGGIAHQLRNAITGARIALEVHLSDRPNKRSDENLEVAIRQMVFMESYLHKFLTFDPDTEPNFVKVDLGDLIKDTIPLIAPHARHFAIELDTQRVSNLEIEGDAVELQQAVLNLLLNSIESVTSRCCHDATVAGWVRVELVTTGALGVKLSIQDNGIGWPSSLGSRILEPFVSTKKDGIGLGLSIVSRVVKAHGGQLNLSQQGSITISEIRLPLRQTLTN